MFRVLLERRAFPPIEQHGLLLPVGLLVWELLGIRVVCRQVVHMCDNGLS